MLFEMFNDEQNVFFVQFLSPIVDEFDKLNKVFQSEDPDPSKLYADLSLFVKCLLQRVVLPAHASPDTDWEGHLLHVRACHMGSHFHDDLEKSSLSEDEKTAILERCRAFFVACIKSVLKRLPSNLNLLSDLHLLHCNSIGKFSFDFLFKAFAQLMMFSDVSTMESEYILLQCRLRDFRDDSVTKFWKNLKEATNSAQSCMFHCYHNGKSQFHCYRNGTCCITAYVTTVQRCSRTCVQPSHPHKDGLAKQDGYGNTRKYLVC